MNSKSAQRRLWIGFLGGPVVWSLYFVLVYSHDEAACNLNVVAPSTVFPVATLFGVLSLGLIGASLYLSYLAWRLGEGQEQARFAGLAGLVMNGLFVLMTVAVWAITWVLPPC